MSRSPSAPSNVMSLALLLYVGLAGLQIPLGASSRLAPADGFLLVAAVWAVTSNRLQTPRRALPWMVLPVLLCYGLLIGMLGGRPVTQYIVFSKLFGGISLATAGFLFQGSVHRLGTHRVCKGLFVGSVIVNSLGFAEFQFEVLLRRGFVYDSSQVGRFSGLAVDSNANAALLAATILCGAHLLATAGIARWRRRVTQLALVWCSYLFIISYSRGALLAAAGAGGYYWYRQTRIGVLRRPHPVTILSFSVIGVGIYLRSSAALLLGGRTDLRSVDARMELLEGGLELLGERDPNWVSGVGLGTFHTVHGQVIHNTPAWLYVEMGFAGVLGMIIMTALVRRWHRVAIRRAPADAGLWLSIVFVYALMSLSIEALYQRPLWVALGCLAGAAAPRVPGALVRDTDRDTSASRRSGQPSPRIRQPVG